MIVGQAELAFRAQHAAALHAADPGFPERDAGARDVAALTRKDALHAGPRVRRAAHHDVTLAAADIDGTQAQAVGVGMRRRLHDIADDEAGQWRPAILDALDLEPDGGQTLADLGRCGRGLQMLAQPGQRELHRPAPALALGMSSAAKP